MTTGILIGTLLTIAIAVGLVFLFRALVTHLGDRVD